MKKPKQTVLQLKESLKVNEELQKALDELQAKLGDYLTVGPPTVESSVNRSHRRTYKIELTIRTKW